MKDGCWPGGPGLGCKVGVGAGVADSVATMFGAIQVKVPEGEREGAGFSTSWVTRFSTRAPVLLQCEVPAIPCKDGAINVLHKCLEVRFS